MRVLYGVTLTSGFPNRQVSNYLNSLLHWIRGCEEKKGKLTLYSWLFTGQSELIGVYLIFGKHNI